MKNVVNLPGRNLSNRHDATAWLRDAGDKRKEYLAFEVGKCFLLLKI